MDRPENELLLCCATLCDGPDRIYRIRNLTGTNIDWAYFVRTARRHRVMSLLYWNLKKIHFEAVPEGVVKELCDEYRINMIRSLLLSAKLFNLVDLFQANGISVIPYKGPTLSVLAYGDIGLRHFADLDFLIRREDVLRAKQLLLSEGYTPECSLAPDQELAYLDHECEYNFYHDKTKLLVELHWEIVQRYFSCRLDVKQLWDDLRTLALLGKQVMTLSLEKLVLVLCMHSGGKHQWESLGWICDIAQLISLPKELDWNKILEIASRSGIERILFLGLYLAKDMLGADVPSVIKRSLMSDRAIPSLAEEVRKRIFDGAGRPLGEAERFVFYLRMRENFRDRFRYLLRRLFTSTKTDWSLVKLPGRLFPLYRFLRPFRLIKKFGREALRLG